MSLPPVQINVKRRRQDDPIDLLYLESDRHQTKRRITEYCFQRVSSSGANAGISKLPPTNPAPTPGTALVAPGPPAVRATSAGAEIREEAERWRAQLELHKRYLNGTDPPRPATLLDDSIVRTPEQNNLRPPFPRRHFRLCCDLRPVSTASPYGIRKKKSGRDGWYATIVEKSSPAVETSWASASKMSTESVPDSVRPSGSSKAFDPPSWLPRQRKIGQSMHDHPSTWDYDSDQLAEELAAYAKDLSLSRSKVRGQGQTSNHKHPPKDSDSHRVEHDADEQSVSSQEFITETFIRVPIGSERGRPEDDDTDTETNHNNIGLLVISDEDQETWQAFADDGDSDTEWDEEDPDSNAEDNPANDYPEEELDDQDEHGHGAYGYRRFGSDDEQYDLSRSWSESE